ncbi:MAG TPA: hypothetical protein VGC95_02660 [Chitinophagaceae bacterium]
MSIFGFLIAPFGVQQLTAQSKIGLSQYNYLDKGGFNHVMPAIHYESVSGWNGEGRYNYEAQNSLAFFAGKNFSGHRGVQWSLVPKAGAIVGGFTGGAVGITATLERHRVFLYTEPEFAVASSRRNQNFFYNWAEAGYNIGKRIFAGVAAQQTIEGGSTVLEKGLMAGVQTKNFRFPIYFFQPFDQQQYFILGVSWEWQ